MCLKTSKGEKSHFWKKAFLCVRKKEDRKNKIEKREKFPQSNILKEDRKKRKFPTRECTKYRFPHSSVHVSASILT